MLIKLSTAVIFILIVSVLPLTLLAQEWGEISEEEWELQPPEDYSNTGAVVIFDHGLSTTERRGLEYKRHTRLKVFNSKDIDNIKNVKIEYYDYDNLFDQKAQVHHPDGTITKLDKKEFEIIEKGSRRECNLTFKNISDGDILEYTYKIDYYGGYDKLGPEKYFMFSQEKRYLSFKAKEKRATYSFDSFGGGEESNLPSWFFDHPVFCLESRYVAKLGADLDYSFFTANIPVELIKPVMKRIKILTATVYKSHTWEMQNIPPTKSDTSGFYDEEYLRPSLNFQLFSTVGTNEVYHVIFSDKHFEYLGRSFQGYINEYFKKTKNMRKKTKKLVSDLGDPLAKVEAIYNFVSNEYEIDSAGYDLRPVHNNMKNLYKKKKGMSFELNLLLIQLLRIAGFDAWPVLISTRNKISYRWTGKFNHMLVLVDVEGESLYLDISAEKCSPGFLNPKCLVTDGILVDYDASKPCHVKAELCESK